MSSQPQCLSCKFPPRSLACEISRWTCPIGHTRCYHWCDQAWISHLCQLSAARNESSAHLVPALVLVYRPIQQTKSRDAAQSFRSFFGSSGGRSTPSPQPKALLGQERTVPTLAASAHPLVQQGHASCRASSHAPMHPTVVSVRFLCALLFQGALSLRRCD